jgi:hypothetical protein
MIAKVRTMMIKLLVATVTLALAVATAKDDEQRYGTPDRQGFARGTVAAVPPDATDSDLGRPAQRSAILRRARATEMSELPDDTVKEIAAMVAIANSVGVSSVQTSKH